MPYSTEQINRIAGRYVPSTQMPYNNEAFAYWERALAQRASYALDITLPDIWSDDDLKSVFLFWLFSRGFVGIYDDPKRGLVFQPGTIGGYDFYYRPKWFIVTNPVDPDSGRQMEIGKECCIVKICPDYGGIWDIIDFYGRKLADLSLSADMSIINTRFAKVLAARNKAAAEALKKILDKINRGEPAVIADKDVLLTDDRTDKASPFQDFSIENLKNNYITDLQLKDIRTVLNQFDNEIGIASVPYEKKERLIVAEVDSSTEDSVARVTVWLDTLTECFKKLKRMYGVDMSARLRSKGGSSDVSGNNDDNRTL